MLYLLAASSSAYTDPRQLRAALCCSLCDSIPPPSRILQPQLMQALLHCSAPLASGQTGMSQGAGRSEMERAVGQWQETVLPGAVVTAMRRVVGLVLGARLWEIPGTGLGSARSSPVTAQGLGSSLAQDDSEVRGAVAPAGQLWEVALDGQPVCWACMYVLGYTRVCSHV